MTDNEAPMGSDSAVEAEHDWIICDGCDERVDRATLNPLDPVCPHCGWSLWPVPERAG